VKTSNLIRKEINYNLILFVSWNIHEAKECLQEELQENAVCVSRTPSMSVLGQWYEANTDTHILVCLTAWGLLFLLAACYERKAWVRVILRPTVSRPVSSGIRRPFHGNCLRTFAVSIIVGRPLWREDGPVNSCCWAPPTQNFSSLPAVFRTEV
jgi:hypothetical protein